MYTINSKNLKKTCVWCEKDIEQGQRRNHLMRNLELTMWYHAECRRNYEKTLDSFE